jgi:hypothetical protein
MCDSVRVLFVALVAAFPPKRLDLPRLADGVLGLPKQIGGIHQDGDASLPERGCVDLFAGWPRCLHHCRVCRFEGAAYPPGTRTVSRQGRKDAPDKIRVWLKETRLPPLVPGAYVGCI